MAALIDWVNALGTPVLGFVAYQIWRIRVNELPHLQADIEALKAICKEHK